MPDNIASLLETIEQLRQEMIDVYTCNCTSLHDPAVLKKSQMLDIQLNQLNMLTYK